MIENILTEKCISNYSQFGKGLHVAVWGNSHAYAFFPLFEKLGLEYTSSISLQWKGGGTPGLDLSIPDYAEYSGEVATSEYKKYHQTVIEMFKHYKEIFPKGQINVVLASRWMHSLGKALISEEQFEYLDKSKTHSGSLKLLKDATEKTIQTLRSVGVDRILIILPFPEYSYETLRCINSMTGKCFIQREKFENYRYDIVKIFEDISSSYKDVKTYDPVKYICNSVSCPQIIERNGTKIPVVFDDDHPSAEMARILAVESREEIKWIFNQP